jgi:nucleoside-diphosphate-sugar epimerase
MIGVSGSRGFIGGRLVQALSSDGLKPAVLARGVLPKFKDGIDTVFHCAGYAHAFSSLSANDAAMHWQGNFEYTRNLVVAAGKAGIQRFVFLSSVKAMAEPGDALVDEGFLGEPETAYGQSKRAAELAVIEAGKCYGMHVVNLRLAMVYGSGGRGNLERMGRLVGRGLFPPLPETGNHRSLVHVDDVVSAMRLVAFDDRAAGKTYIVASQHAPSGRELFNALRTAHGLSSCTWMVPELVLRAVAGSGDVLGMLLKRRLPLNSEVLVRLLGSAWYSPSRIERELGWQARISLVDGLSEMLQ